MLQIKTSDKKRVIKNERQKTSDKKRAITAENKISSQKSDERKRLIISYLTIHGTTTSKEIAKHLGISPNRARVSLQELIAQNIVITEGENRNRTYHLTLRG